MKKISILLLSSMLLFLGACKDNYLDSNPIVLQTAEGYFKTPKNALEGLTGCYNGLTLDQGSSFYFISTVASDEAFAGGGQGEASAGVPYGWDEFKEAGDKNQNKDIWKNRYASIYRCNSFLANIGGVNWGDQSALAVKYEAEARFLRAFYYFDLVRFFGNIPLITSATVVNTKQADPKDVYAFIAKDLKFAIDNLPSTSYAGISSSEYGHATKWAAESLMARVFLFYTGRYTQTDLVGVITKTDALGYLEDVIAHSGYGLVSEFKNLWPVSIVSGTGKYEGEDNKETVFAIKYTWGPNFGGLGNNRWLINLGLRWSDGNPFPYSWGWGQATVSQKYWNNVYEAGDTRKTASIISIADELQNSTSTIDSKTGIVNSKGKTFNSKQFADYTGYFNKKYVPLSTIYLDKDKGEYSFLEYPKSLDKSNNAQYDQCEDWVIIRYADVLLMAAELGSPNADTYFNWVRDRAFGDKSHEISGVTIADIRKERQREFAFEGIRYWDLLRYGPTIAAQEINTVEVVTEGGLNKTKTIVYDVTKNGLFQIPLNQIDLSKENGVQYLVQNPGW